MKPASKQAAVMGPTYTFFESCVFLMLFSSAMGGNGDVSSFQLLARLSFPTVETKPYNLPSAKEIDPRHSYADEKFERLQEYYSYMNSRIKEPHNPIERREILETAQKRLFTFIDTHIKDLKRLLFETDMALMSMVLLKLNKKMDTSEAKIKSTQAKIPFGLYASPGLLRPHTDSTATRLVRNATRVLEKRARRCTLARSRREAQRSTRGPARTPKAQRSCRGPAQREAQRSNRGPARAPKAQRSRRRPAQREAQRSYGRPALEPTRTYALTRRVELPRCLPVTTS
ncbi:uncharacterized protein LOC123722617 [Papilio machaon]|uniref:uncharacterized protein LOC123722617 n=1 Tax=Papilio machaon TaxID=76193 RepID=UPI001E66307A|nr:uncharacterized protein LOC123722617 [Papilio machaon]